MLNYRFTGSISLDDAPVTPGHICNVQLNQYSETTNFLQCLSPLSQQNPYFFAQIRSLGPASKIVIGIAGPDISTDAQPGHWPDSVGYHSDTGHCFSNYQCIANTVGEQFGIGDVFGVLVTYFGEDRSTVIFLRNGNPVATRFLTEPSHSRFLPTLSLENGPIDLGLMWPEAAVGVPKFCEKNMLHWIKPAAVVYNLLSNTFEYKSDKKIKGDVMIQSPTPMSLENDYLEIVLQDQTTNVPPPSISFASCSPMFPYPSKSLLNDYVQFDTNQNIHLVSKGNVIGLGIHYNQETRKKPDFNPKGEQLVYCYFTVNHVIVDGNMMLQPEGGFYPLVLPKNAASKFSIDVECSARTRGFLPVLEQSFKEKLPEALHIGITELLTTEVKESMLRTSSAVKVTVQDEYCRLHLPKGEKGIHVVQFNKPLSKEDSCYLLTIRKLSEDSGVGIGVAGNDFPLNKIPGMQNSTASVNAGKGLAGKNSSTNKYPTELSPSVGWFSKDGKLYRNSRSDSNLQGAKFREGDIVGVEMEAFAAHMSVALFIKNLQPVGTVYYTQPDRDQFLPTVALCSNGEEIVIDVRWQNTMKATPLFNFADLHHWCLPPGAKVDSDTNTVYVPEHASSLSIQAPYSLHRGYNHYEVRITEASNILRPAVVLSTACPLDQTPTSCLKLDYLRCWPVNEASCMVNTGDLLGWGLLYLDNDIDHDEEQLVLCYLTVNRKITLVRVVYQAPGGLYPLVVLPSGLNEVTLEFSGTIIKRHPITPKDMDILVGEAKDILEKEKAILAGGGDPTAEFNRNAMFRNLPSAVQAAKQGAKQSTHAPGSAQTVQDMRVENSGKTNRMVMTMKSNQLKKTPSNKSHKGDQKGSQSCSIL